MTPRKRYKVGPDYLRHVLTWLSASDAKKEINLTEIFMEPGEDGLVRLAKGWVMTDRTVQLGSTLTKAPCLLHCTWTYLGMCRDWRNHRLPQFDLNLQEDTKARLLAIKEWNASHYPTTVNSLRK